MPHITPNPKHLNRDARIAILAAEFNRPITERLVQGAERVLLARGVAAENIDCIWVPGAFELPQVAWRLYEQQQKPTPPPAYAALIALGAVIRGETAHFDYVADSCTRGLAQLSRCADIPVAFGVLTVDNADQAMARSELAPDADNRGAAAAECALSMISVLSQVGGLPAKR